MEEQSLIKTYVILEKSKSPYIKQIYDLDNIKVWEVDGKWVRENKDMDFTHGGNNGAYSWIPKDEIWIDDGLNQDEVAVTALHELVERKEMLAGGLDYNRAHDIAIRIERSFRMRPEGILDKMKELAAEDMEKSKRIYVPQSSHHVAYYREDPRTAKAGVKEAAYVTLQPEITPDATPDVVMAIGPSGRKYFFENVRLYPESRRLLTYGNLVELQKTSPTTKLVAEVKGKSTFDDRPVLMNVEARWLALPELKPAVKGKYWLADQGYPALPQAPKGTPEVGETILWKGHWAKVESQEGDTLAIKIQYDEVDKCPPGEDPNRIQRISFQEAFESKRKTEGWEKEYQKYWESTPIAVPKVERDRQILSVENSRLRHKKDYEQANIYDYAGQLLFTKDGEKDDVSFSDSDGQKMSGAILTHNHPHAGSFSDDDVWFAFAVGLAEMRAVTENYVYILRPPEGLDTFPTQLGIRSTPEVHDSFIDQAIDEAVGDSSNAYGPKLKANEISMSDMNEVAWDYTWQILAKELGFRYERYRWADAEIRKPGPEGLKKAIGEVGGAGGLKGRPGLMPKKVPVKTPKGVIQAYRYVSTGGKPPVEKEKGAPEAAAPEKKPPTGEQAQMGDKVVVDGQVAHVTAVGQHGITARTADGTPYQKFHGDYELAPKPEETPKFDFGGAAPKEPKEREEFSEGVVEGLRQGLMDAMKEGKLDKEEVSHLQQYIEGVASKLKLGEAKGAEGKTVIEEKPAGPSPKSAKLKFAKPPGLPEGFTVRENPLTYEGQKKWNLFDERSVGAANVGGADTPEELVDVARKHEKEHPLPEKKAPSATFKYRTQVERETMTPGKEIPLSEIPKRKASEALGEKMAEKQPKVGQVVTFAGKQLKIATIGATGFTATDEKGKTQRVKWEQLKEDYGEGGVKEEEKKPAKPEPKSREEIGKQLKEAFKSTKSLPTETLFDAMKQGKAPAGVDDVIWRVAKPAYDSGKIKSAGDLKEYLERAKKWAASF